MTLAGELSDWVDGHPRLERLTPTRLNLVCLAHVDGDDATQALLDGVNRSGRAAMTHTRLGGRLAVRVCVGQTSTERRHVDALRTLIDEHV